MNNELKIFYDEKTTAWLDKHWKMLKDYETILWDHINNSEMSYDLSYEERHKMFQEDNIRNQIIRIVGKVLDSSIPIGMEIINLDDEDES